MQLPLKGIRVLDMTTLLPGPFCTMSMADMGAEVIKIENDNGGDGFRARKPSLKEEGAAFHMINRGKKSFKVNLKDENEKNNFLKLAATADVIIEQFRPGVVKRLGVDYETIKAINPGIIYCSISGFGQTGPNVKKPGHDINYLSIAGVLDTIGEKGKAPALAGIQVADLGCSQWALSAILFALIARDKNSGMGQYIDVSMTDCALPWMTHFMSDYIATGKSISRGDTQGTGKYAFYHVYKTKDGKYVTLGAVEAKFWKNFCELVHRPELAQEQYSDDLRKEEVISEVAGIFASKTRDEWCELLGDKDVCFAPVKNLEEALSDEQFISRGMIIETDHPVEGKIKNIAFPIKFSEMQPDYGKGAPMYGEHNEELLKEIGAWSK